MKSYITPKNLSLGPIMCDLRGTQLEVDEYEFLLHPLVGGVILFSRNYESPEQLIELTNRIRELRKPALLIAVDHEGGRVQRFHEGFSILPACGLIGRYESMAQAELLAENTGWLMAAELLSVGVDFSFAPVLDVGGNNSSIIGDRAFNSDPEKIFHLAKAYISGMDKAGMPAVGKHFPGHGSVKEDSHISMPVDQRKFEEIDIHDMVPFKGLIRTGISGLMPAHVTYPDIDNIPAGFSSVWLNRVLREQLKFRGAIFSDDLSMKGAEIMGDYAERTKVALEAGCDMTLICNNQEGVVYVLDNIKVWNNNQSQTSLENMHGDFNFTYDDLRSTKMWKECSNVIGMFLKNEI